MMTLHYMRLRFISFVLFKGLRPKPESETADFETYAYHMTTRRSDASYPHRRSLQFILAYVPTTARRAKCCLLCCQPEPMPGALTARMSLLTLRDPCRLLVWSG